ncbi:MAG: hypothetical protein V1696_02690 [Candidatus Jorgensenbacteria bacterium]
MKEKIKIIIPIFFAVIFIGISAYLWISSRDSFKCPNDYATVEEYIDGTARWISEETDKNPDISEENILEMRTKELEAHGCERSKWLNG